MITGIQEVHRSGMYEINPVDQYGEAPYRYFVNQALDERSTVMSLPLDIPAKSRFSPLTCRRERTLSPPSGTRSVSFGLQGGGLRIDGTATLINTDVYSNTATYVRSPSALA